PPGRRSPRACRWFLPSAPPRWSVRRSLPRSSCVTCARARSPPAGHLRRRQRTETPASRSDEEVERRDPSVSHHFDSAADRADGRINPCDLYAFPGAPGTSAVIVTVNPDAGRSSPATFRPAARYEFPLASGGGTTEDIAFGVTFTEPGDTGRQRVRVRRAEGPAAREGAAGTLWGEGRTGEVFPLTGGGLAWAGLAADPFTAEIGRASCRGTRWASVSG